MRRPLLAALAALAAATLPLESTLAWRTGHARALTDLARPDLPVAVPQRERVTTVRPGDVLQSALDAGGVILLEPGATFEAPRFSIRASGTTVRGGGATLRGLAGPALHVLPGVSDVVLEDLVCLSDRDQSVVQLGDNEAETQSRIDQVPRRITLRRLAVPTHRGKRALEVHAAEVQILDGEVADVWDPALRDSQAIWIGNTPGPVTVRGGSYSAGSEVILVGGDTVRIADVIPSDLAFEDLTLHRPLAWRTDGVKRAVKNILELKTGHRVRVTDVVMDGAWRDAQDGYAVVLTPTRGGSVVDVEFARVTMRNVTGGFNIAGRDSHGISSTRTTDVVVRESSLVTNRAELGGRGILALITGGPGRLEFHRIVAAIDGTSLIHQSGPPAGPLVLRDSLVVAGRYGLNLGGTPNARSWTGAVEDLDVRDNVIAGAAAALRRSLPANRFVPREEFDRLMKAEPLSRVRP